MEEDDGGATGSAGLPLFLFALRLRVDGGHVAETAVEAAHREEDALLRAG